MNPEIKVKVINKFNFLFGKDVKTLSQCEDLFKRLQEEKEEIENMFSLASSKVPSKVSAAVSDVDNACKKIERLSADYESLSSAVKNCFQKTNDTVIKLQKHVNEIEQLEQLLIYLTCIRAIENLNQELESALNEDDDERAIAEFTRLCAVCSQLHNSKCTHLVAFLRETVHYWHNILKTKFFKQFEEILKAVNWPIVSSNNLLSTPSPESIPKFQLLIKHLLLIQLPDELVSKSVVQSSVQLLSSNPLSSPILLLVRPLKKRFIYHFCGNKQTNRPDKPEWFLTQILSWIRDNEQFVDRWVQPVFKEVGIQNISATVELMRGLVQLALEKLDNELPSMQYDDSLFSHAVDESLGFDKELKETFGYPSSLPSTITVLTQAQIFTKWINMERKYAREKMDAMLNSETAWLPFSCIEGDEMKVTEVGEAFLTLLSTITERYRTLPQPGHRLQFLDVQLELIDDFRVRLIQLLHTEQEDPLDSRLPAILNTASYISTALSEWGTDPHFLMLQHYKSQLEIVGEHKLSTMQIAALQQGSVFDDALQLFDRLIEELIDCLCENVILETKARSRPYRRDRWFAMSSPCDEISPSVTPTACPMFQVLAAKLHQLEQLLATPLFDSTWKKIATQLNTFILEELILPNTFNPGGAEQLQLDMTRNLFPLFRQYTKHPEVYFSQIQEACILLTFRPLPSDILRNGVTKNNLSLLNIKLQTLSDDQAVEVLKRCVELSIDVM
ncbi:RAD50 interactor 1 [Lycorma delicatula]|uniref:RAD50 interactor 1 n=1 Tax=Lycorma delicatula TaxID=130591 RepID=UPI003F5120AB